MNAKVIRKSDVAVESTDWGSLQWLVSDANNASEHMTFGRVTLKPGQANPPHHHPNGEEILFVVSGELEHTLPQGEAVTLRAGDCIVLPAGGIHWARNLGETEAVVIVAFNSACRKVVGE